MVEKICNHKSNHWLISTISTTNRQFLQVRFNKMFFADKDYHSILASSQRKLWKYIKFEKADVAIKNWIKIFL